MVQSLPGFLNLSLNVCSPCQVLGDVYTEVLEATHPLHRGPTDHKRSVGPLLSLPEVYNQLFSFVHVQRETVVLAPWCESLHLIQVSAFHGYISHPQHFTSSKTQLTPVTIFSVYCHLASASGAWWQKLRDWGGASSLRPITSSLLLMRPRTTVSSANLTIEVELWEDTQSWVYRE